MDKITVKDRDIVVPGELLADGMSFLPNGRAFREGSKVYASSVGIVNVKGHVIKVIPLSGRYMPKVGDAVIGKVISIGHSGWSVDINCPYNADLNIGDAVQIFVDLNKTDLTRFYKVGDYMIAGIYKITETGYIKLTTRDRQYRKLEGGNIIKISPTKIPRVIGKQGSMITMLKQGTGCDIFVGQNGLVWINGDAEKIAVAAQLIYQIERESHTSGLTDRIKKQLDKGGK